MDDPTHLTPKRLLLATAALLAGLSAAPSDLISTARDFLTNAHDTIGTTRLATSLAALPIFLSILANTTLAHAHHHSQWPLFHLAMRLLIIAKLLATPLALGLLASGALLADADVALLGITTLAFIHAAAVGSWTGASRLSQLLHWTPDAIAMRRWHVDGRGAGVAFGRDDPYRRGTDAFRRLLARAAEESGVGVLSWPDELVIALLATKFVSLSQKELDWRETVADGAECKPSVEDLLTHMARWEKGWHGQPGRWLREWTATEIREGATLHDKTLRFVIVLFECIRRSDVQDLRHQKALLQRVLSVDRDGDMSWVYALLRECLDERSVAKSVGKPAAAGSDGAVGDASAERES